MIKEDDYFLLYPTKGESMFPFIHWDECIVVKKMPADLIRLGDVIVFGADGKQKVCHRVVKIEERDGLLWFHTKGDRNRFCDKPLRQEKILGRVVALRRKTVLVALSVKGIRYLLFRFDCIFTWVVFRIRRFLAKIISLLQRYNLYRMVAKPILSRGIYFDVSDQKTRYGFSASKNNRKIGSVYLYYSENYPHPGWWLGSLEVRSLYRRLGIGKQIVRNLIGFALDKGIDILYLNVCKENSIALRLYEKSGFSIEPGSERFNENLRQTFVYMQINLDGYRPFAVNLYPEETT